MSAKVKPSSFLFIFASTLPFGESIWLRPAPMSVSSKFSSDCSDSINGVILFAVAKKTLFSKARAGSCKLLWSIVTVLIELHSNCAPFKANFLDGSKVMLSFPTSSPSCPNGVVTTVDSLLRLVKNSLSCSVNACLSVWLMSSPNGENKHEVTLIFDLTELSGLIPTGLRVRSRRNVTLATI